MMLSIGADQPLPLIEWQRDNPGFAVNALHEAYDGVRRQFTKPHVSMALAHTGCGCGFQYGVIPIDGDDRWAREQREEAAAGRESVRHLSAYLARAVEQGEVELYSCWAGQEADEPEERATIVPSDLGGPVVQFKERQFMIVKQPSADC